MRYDHVETFVDATVRVLESVLDTGFGRGEITLVDGGSLRGEIAVAVPLAGEIEGCVAIHLSRETALKLLNRGVGAAHRELPPLGLDYLQELGNLIAGAAASALNDRGHDVTVAPPLGTSCPWASLALPEVEACQIPIVTEFGSLSVDILLTTA